MCFPTPKPACPSGRLLVGSKPRANRQPVLYARPMEQSRTAFRVTILALLLAVPAALAAQPGASGSQQAASSRMATELRYIGRDTLTGMPARVDDRFIAAVEHAIERYGKDRGEPVPPPPPGPVDVASLSIPSIGVSQAAIGRFGLDAFGRLDVPQDSATVGWNPAYNDLPGEGGATFFAAHYEYQGRPGVFFRLSSLAPGDAIEVTLAAGEVYRYRVTSAIEYALGSIDMGAILRGREGRESITLMTCSGPANEGEYAHRTVVLAERVE